MKFPTQDWLFPKLLCFLLPFGLLNITVQLPLFLITLIFLLLFIYFYFLAMSLGMWGLSFQNLFSRPGIEPTPLHWKSSLNHWTNKEIPPLLLKKKEPPAFIKVKMKSLSCVRLFVTPWMVAHQASPSMGFSRQEYWSGLPFPSPGDLPNPGIELGSPAL